MAEVTQRYGRLDVLVNNAGTAFKGSDPTPFEEQASLASHHKSRKSPQVTQTRVPHTHPPCPPPMSPPMSLPMSPTMFPPMSPPPHSPPNSPPLAKSRSNPSSPGLGFTGGCPFPSSADETDAGCQLLRHARSHRGTSPASRGEGPPPLPTQSPPPPPPPPANVPPCSQCWRRVRTHEL